MKKIFLACIAVFTLISSNIFAADVLIDEDGNIETGTSNADANLEVTGASGEHSILGETSGTAAAGVYGVNTTDNNYGILGYDSYGVYGYSSSGYAGYFEGDAMVTGNFTVEGVLTGTGLTIIGGTISQTYIDPIITRDGEIMSIVLSNDGPGSGLDADTLDGKDSSEFSDAAAHTALASRVSTLEGDEAKSFVTRSARAVSDRAYIAEPELEIWIKAAQKGFPAHPLGNLIEVDSNGDGTITLGIDFTNQQLALAGVVSTFVSARAAKGEVSPWTGFPLYVQGPIGDGITRDYCASTAVPGHIVLCADPAEDVTIQNIHIVAFDNEASPNVIYSNSVSGVSDTERRESLVASAKEGTEELEIWIKAAQKGFPAHPLGNLAEVDTNGDGTVDAATGDLTNLQLQMTGVIDQWLIAHQSLKSPWSGLNLYVAGPDGSNRTACEAMADGGHIALCADPTDDVTVESIHIVAFDNEASPNVIYSTSVSGVSDTERRESLVASAKEGTEELEIWIKAAEKGSPVHPHRLLHEIDTNGDGVIDYSDLNNQGLATAGVLSSYVSAANALGLFSPWTGNPMYQTGIIGAGTTRPYCAAAPVGGHIVLCADPAENETVQSIHIVAFDNEASPNVIYSKSISGTSDTERRDSIVESAKEELDDLGRWMAAVRKAGGPEGGNNEVDSNGDGVITVSDRTNDELASYGVITIFTASRAARGDVSPWPHSFPLWANGGTAANQPACDSTAIYFPGRITLCYQPAEDETIDYIFISVADYDISPNIIYSKTLSAH
jgi:hypothetical protein